MAVTARFVADFESFQNAVTKAQAQLQGFEGSAGKVEKSLNKMVDSFSGRKLIQEATIMNRVLGDSESIALLTGKELQAAGAKAAEASDKMRRLGIDVPPGLQRIVAEAKKMETSFGGSLMNSVKAFGPAITAAFSFTAIAAAGNKLIDFASHLTDLSQRTGISTTGLQKLQLAFEQSGISLDTVTTASDKLAKNLIGGDKSAIGALQKLGLSVQELKQMAPEAQLLKVADAVGRIESPTEKAYAAMTIFGKGGAELLAGLTGHLQETTKEFEAMGLIIDEKTIKAADDFGDQLMLMGKQLLGIVASIVGPLLPALSALATGVSYLANIFKDVLGGAIKIAQTAIGFFIVGFAELLSTIVGAATKIPIIGKHLGALGDAATFLRGYSIETEKAVAALWATTDKVGTSATKARPALLGLGEDMEKSAANAKKFREEFEKHTEAVHKVEAAFFGLTESVGRADERELNFVKTSVALRAEMDKVEETAHIANFGFKGMADGLENVGQKVRDLGPDIAHQFVGPIQEAAKIAISFGDTLKSALGGALGGLNDIFQRAFEGGGGVLGAVKSFATKMTSSLLGTIPVIGGFLSQFSGAIVGLFGKLFGGDQQAKQVKQMRDQFIAASGGLVELQKQAKLAGVSLDTLLSTKKVDVFKNAMQQLNDAMDAQKQDAADLDAAVQRYGFSIEQLGPTMQKQKLDEQAKEILNDWRLLVGSGIDVTVVNEKMAQSVQGYLDMARKTGMEVPSAMKPILQSMIDQGTLVDENGNLITDLGQIGVAFSETMTQGFDRIVQKLQELLQQLGKVPDAITNIPQPGPIHIPIVYDDPGFDQRSQNTYAAMGGLVTSHGIEPQYFGMGGRVLPFRPRGTDTVPAMLTPGERVLSRQQNAAYEAGQRAGTMNTDALESEIRQLRSDIRRLLPKAIRDAIILAG